MTIVFIFDKVIRQAFKDFIEDRECLRGFSVIQQIPDTLLIGIEQTRNPAAILIDVALIEHRLDSLFQRSHLDVSPNRLSGINASPDISHFLTWHIYSLASGLVK